METSKVVPPPLGEPPSPLTPPTLPAAQSGAVRTGLRIAGEPREQIRGPLQEEKKKSPALEHQVCGSRLRRGIFKYFLLKAKPYWR